MTNRAEGGSTDNSFKSSLRIVPMGLKDSNAWVTALHRHHRATTGHKFSIGVVDEWDTLRGVAICGRPVARELAKHAILEVNRVCTDGCPNACSALYGACRRIAKEMGYDKIITYILDTEPGTSLKGAGWTLEVVTRGHAWNDREGQNPRNNDFPLCKKQRYASILRS